MKEGDNITPADLIQKWVDSLDLFDLFIENGYKLRPIRFLIRYIIDKGYNTKLYPGSSLYTLLISIPADNKINYDKTLSVGCDQLYNNVVFKYSDFTGLKRNDNNSLKNVFRLEETCQFTEVVDIFEYFLMQVDDWAAIKR